MKKLIALVACLCVVFSASLVIAGEQDRNLTFDPQSVNKWINQTEEGIMENSNSGKDLPTLMKRCVDFRQAMSADTEKAISDFTKDRKAFNPILNSPVNKEFPQVYNYFFSTSIVLIGNALSEAPLVAYYNPFLDSVIYVQWNTVEGDITPVSLAIDSYETLSKNKESIPRWIAKGGTPMALVKNYQEFRAEFESKYHFKNSSSTVLPTINSQEEKRELLESRSLRALFELAAVLRKNKTTTEKAWSVFHQAVTKGDEANISNLIPDSNIMSTQQILEIPQLMRVQLAPAYVLVGEKETLLFQQVESAPKFIGALSVSNNTSLQHSSLIKSFVFFGLDSNQAREGV